MQRTVFFISDGTAITAETLGHSLLTQFAGIQFHQQRIPFVDDETKASEVVEAINAAAESDGVLPIVFNTIVDPQLSQQVQDSEGVVIDLFSTFLPTLEAALGAKRQSNVGLAHGMSDVERYESRMEATNYALNHDDGMRTRYDDADLILVGVSRSGKTPTCIYMALHFGVKAANYPLTDDDLDKFELPKFLRKHKDKLVGLTIEPDRLAQIRETRRPGSRYASIRQCRHEVDTAEALLRSQGVPIFKTTHASIEEIGSRILVQLGIQRELF